MGRGGRGVVWEQTAATEVEETGKQISGWERKEAGKGDGCGGKHQRVFWKGEIPNPETLYRA